VAVIGGPHHELLVPGVRAVRAHEPPPLVRHHDLAHGAHPSRAAGGSIRSARFSVLGPR